MDLNLCSSQTRLPLGGFLERHSSVIQQQWASIEKNPSVFGGLPGASLKTSAFHVVCDQGSDLNNKLFTKP